MDTVHIEDRDRHYGREEEDDTHESRPKACVDIDPPRPSAHINWSRREILWPENLALDILDGNPLPCIESGCSNSNP